MQISNLMICSLHCGHSAKSQDEDKEGSSFIFVWSDNSNLAFPGHSA